jgi:hypothetical protein
MKNIFSGYFSKPGVYTRELEGNVIINSPGVNLKDCKIDGDLIIADGVNIGDIILDNISITGKILVRAGNSLRIVNNSKVEEILINNKKNEINLQIENSNIKLLTLKSGCIVNGNMLR